MKLNDYINGHRSGRAAHDLELEAMLDPLLDDALDGFAGAGGHAEVLARLATRIDASAAGGRAASRLRAAKRRQTHLKVLRTTAAAVFIGGVMAGGAWLMHEGLSEGGRFSARGMNPGIEAAGAGADVHGAGGVDGEVALPPVTVVPNNPAQPTQGAVGSDRQSVSVPAGAVGEAGAAAADSLILKKDSILMK